MWLLLQFPCPVPVGTVALRVRGEFYAQAPEFHARAAEPRTPVAEFHTRRARRRATGDTNVALGAESAPKATFVSIGPP
ncbi:hypothetical protein GCM10027199_15580 [Amycolatopsis magusensis]